jgi:hypothetical protein
VVFVILTKVRENNLPNLHRPIHDTEASANTAFSLAEPWDA